MTALQPEEPAQEHSRTDPVVSGWTEVMNHPKEEGE